MAQEFVPSHPELSRMKSGLVFDAEGVTLIARCTDELTAYRAKKTWKEVFAGYFLLEPGRDYEMSVLASAENNYFVLNCFFISACGRYAFWRLINDQAPEAELKLSHCQGATIATTNKRLSPTTKENPRPSTLFPGTSARSKADRSLLDKTFQHFKKYFL